MMLTGYRVIDGMTTKPIMIDQTVTLQECARIMDVNDVGSLLVHKDRRILGIITEQDLVRKALRAGLDVRTTTVKDVMTRDLVTISPEKDIYDALILMQKNDIRHMPVVDDGQVVGFLTLKDILKIEPALFEKVVGSIEIREEQRKPIGDRVAEEGICEICGNYSKNILLVHSSRVCSFCVDSV
ncbi:MAG: CBS domain-containing protein [Nanoarchaeota archaeon]